MRRTVEMERTRTETVEEEVIICDVCDCEVEGPRRTMAVSPRLERTKEAKDKIDRGGIRIPVPGASAQYRERDLARRAPDFVELVTKAEFDVCEDCIREKFTPEVDLDG